VPIFKLAKNPSTLSRPDWLPRTLAPSTFYGCSIQWNQMSKYYTV